MINLEEREVLLIYDDQFPRDCKALSLAQSMPRYKLREWNIRKEKLSPKQLAELAGHLKLEVKALVATSSELFKDQYSESDLDDQDWLSTLHENPGMLRTPIIAFRSMGKILDSGFELIRKEMGHGGVQSQKAGKQEVQH